MPVDHDFDYCARRAAEEFVAANRADNVDQRRNHRRLAEQYADLVRAMMLARKEAEAANPSETHDSSPDSGNEVQAA